jgi:hypothetical protein
MKVNNSQVKEKGWVALVAVPNLMLLIIASFASIVPTANALSLGLRVLPGSSNSLIGGNNQLWFAVSPGSSETRKFEIINPSSESANVEINVVPAISRDGKIVEGEVQDDDFTQWFDLSPKKFTIKPRSKRAIDVKVSIPKGADRIVESALIFVNVTGNDKNAEIEEGQTVAIAKSIVRLRLPVALYVGNPEDLIVDFEIVELVDFSVDGSKFLAIEFENLGTLPLGLSGKVNLSNVEFPDLQYGPFEFGSQPIAVSELGSARVELPPDFVLGNYKILVSARQSSVEKNRVFEKDLRFPNMSDSSFLSRNMIIFLAVIFILFMGTVFLKRRLPLPSREDKNNS